MSKLIIIGDSNVYRHVRSGVFSAKVKMPVTLLQCTREQTLTSALDVVQREQPSMVLLSILSNFVSDVCGTDFPESYDDMLERVLSLLTCLSDVRLLLVPPLLRYKPDWYRDQFSALVLGLQEKVKSYSQVLLLPEFKLNEHDLESDQVHLSQQTGARFFEYLASAVLDVAPELSIICEVKASSPATTPAPSVYSTDDVMRLLQDKVLPSIASGSRAEEKVDKLSKFVLSRSGHDDLMFARIREELDFKTNLGKANRVLFVSVEGDTVPDQLTAYKTKLTSLIKPLVDKVSNLRNIPYIALINLIN